MRAVDEEPVHELEGLELHEPEELGLVARVQGHYLGPF